MTMKTGIILSLAVGALGAELCNRPANFEPDIIASTTCLQVFSSQTELDDYKCADKGGMAGTEDFNADGVPDYYCLYYMVTSQTECSTAGGTVFSQITCADSTSDWEYSNQSDLEAKCVSDEYFDGDASACCSDGVGVCAQFDSQLCKTDENFQPNALASSTCLKYFSSESEYADGDCVNGIKNSGDVQGDGTIDYYCIYYMATSQSECTAAGGAAASFHSTTCADSASDWQYSTQAEMEDKCAERNEWDDNEMEDFASTCCSDGKSVCSKGSCLRGDTTLNVQKAGSSLRAAVATPLTEVKLGDLVETADAQHRKTWSKVTGLPHSKSSESFVELSLKPEGQEGGGASKGVVVATEHHTFPACGKHNKNKNQAMVPALSLKAGDCVHTVAGERTLSSVRKLSAAPQDVTYTVELEGGADLLVAGGIITHAKPQDAQKAKRATKSASKNASKDALKMRKVMVAHKAQMNVAHKEVGAVMEAARKKTHA